MPWLRRRRRRPSADQPAAPPGDATSAADEASDVGAPTSEALVPLVPAESLERTERALRMLAAQSAQMHGQLVHLEHRVDSLADSLLDRLDAPTHDDVLQARMHSARVAAELARLEVNLAARLEAVRADLRAVQGHDDDLDLRSLAPTDTGWAAVG